MSKVTRMRQTITAQDVHKADLLLLELAQLRLFSMVLERQNSNFVYLTIEVHATEQDMLLRRAGKYFPPTVSLEPLRAAITDFTREHEQKILRQLRRIGVQG